MASNLLFPSSEGLRRSFFSGRFPAAIRMFPKSITFVVPCYNEEAAPGRVYERVFAVAQRLERREFEFPFVNDGSRDGTAGILDLLAGRDPGVKALHLAKNRGSRSPPI